MSVLLIVGPKRTLAASHDASWWVVVSTSTGQTHIQTDGRAPYRYNTLFARRVQRKNNSRARAGIEMADGEWQSKVNNFVSGGCEKQTITRGSENYQSNLTLYY